MHASVIMAAAENLHGGKRLCIRKEGVCVTACVRDGVTEKYYRSVNPPLVNRGINKITKPHSNGAELKLMARQAKGK